MNEDNLKFVLEQLDLNNLKSIAGPEEHLRYLAKEIRRYDREYQASIKIGLTSKNYADREAAYYNALDVMVENGIEILPSQFNRKPSDILYSVDYYFRRNKIGDKDFRRSLLWLITGEDRKLPRVSKAKDKEVTKQELKIGKTKFKLERHARIVEDWYIEHYANNEELWN